MNNFIDCQGGGAQQAVDQVKWELGRWGPFLLGWGIPAEGRVPEMLRDILAVCDALGFPMHPPFSGLIPWIP